SGGCIEDDLVARREEYAGQRPAFAAYGVTADEARRFGLPCGGEVEVLIEPDVAVTAFESLLAELAQGHVVARHVDLSTGVWTLDPARAGDECVRTEARLTSVH